MDVNQVFSLCQGTIAQVPDADNNQLYIEHVFVIQKQRFLYCLVILKAICNQQQILSLGCIFGANHIQSLLHGHREIELPAVRFVIPNGRELLAVTCESFHKQRMIQIKTVNVVLDQFLD